MDRYFFITNFLIFVAIITTIYINQINRIVGGQSDCFLCKKISYNGSTSNWTATHFFLFLFLGFMCPKQALALIALGIIWEIVELIFEYSRSVTQTGYLYIFSSRNKKKVNACPSNIFWEHYLGIKNHKLKLFWCSDGFLGSVIDTIANIAGVYTGVFLASRFMKRRK